MMSDGREIVMQILDVVLKGLMVLGLLVVPGCAEFAQWVQPQEGSSPVVGLDYVEPSSASVPPEAGPEDIKEAVHDLRGYLEEQEARIGKLLAMRGELESQIQEGRETVMVPLRERVETFEGRLQEHEAVVEGLANELATAIGPLQEIIKAQGERIDQHDQQFVVLIDSANQDKDAMRTNFENFRNALVGFHSVMNNLETLVYDEEFRATNVENRLSGQLKEATARRQQLGEVSATHAKTLAGLQENMKGLRALEQRLVALHTYINEVRQGLGGELNSLRARTVSHPTADTIYTQPAQGNAMTGRPSHQDSSVVPTIDAILNPPPKTASPSSPVKASTDKAESLHRQEGS